MTFSRPNTEELQPFINELAHKHSSKLSYAELEKDLAVDECGSQGYHWIDVSNLNIVKLPQDFRKDFDFIAYCLNGKVLYRVKITNGSPNTLTPSLTAEYNIIVLIPKDNTGNSVCVWNRHTHSRQDLTIRYSHAQTTTHETIPRRNYTEEYRIRHSNGGSEVLVKNCRLHYVSNSPVPLSRKNHFQEGIAPSVDGIEDLQY